MMARRPAAAAPARRPRVVPVADLVRVAPALVSVLRGALPADLVRAAPALVSVRGALPADLVAPAVDLVQVVEARTIGQTACLPAATPPCVGRCRAAMAGAA